MISSLVIMLKSYRSRSLYMRISFGHSNFIQDCLYVQTSSLHVFLELYLSLCLYRYCLFISVGIQLTCLSMAHVSLYFIHLHILMAHHLAYIVSTYGPSVHVYTLHAIRISIVIYATYVYYNATASVILMPQCHLCYLCLL